MMNQEHCPVCGSKDGYEGHLVIDFLYVSDRIRNILLRSNIYTVECLKQKSDQELLRYRGFGPDTLAKVRKAIARFDEVWP